MTLIGFFSRREKGEVFIKAICFLLASFAYLTINFLQFYKEYFFMSLKMNVLLMLLLDISMAALVYLWIRLVCEIVSPEKVFGKSAVVIALSAIYVSGWLLVYLFFTDADYYIYSSFGKSLSALLDSLFFCGTLVYISYNLFKQIKMEITNIDKLYLAVINGILIIYMGWFYTNDITLIYFTYGAELWDVYLYDSVVLFYVLINVATMVYSYKRNEALSLNEKPGGVSQSENKIEIFPPVLMSEVAKKYELTRREEEIILLVYKGLSNPEISEHLYISTSTVKRHMQNIFRKMNIKHRSELIHLVKPQ